MQTVEDRTVVCRSQDESETRGTKTEPAPENGQRVEHLNLGNLWAAGGASSTSCPEIPRGSLATEQIVDPFLHLLAKSTL